MGNLIRYQSTDERDDQKSETREGKLLQVSTERRKSSDGFM